MHDVAVLVPEHLDFNVTRCFDVPLQQQPLIAEGAAGFVRSIARETGRYGITSNAISLSTLAPPLDEDAMSRFLASDHAKAQLARYTIRRYGKPDDVAYMALFLCSDAASWITGQTYPVNGGYSFAQ